MDTFIYDLSILLVGATVLSFLAVMLKQPIIIAYILCGTIVGPWGFGLIKEVHFIETISHLGITLLLFLAGLCLHPQHLIRLFKKTSLIALANCVASFFLAFGFTYLFGFGLVNSIFIGLALMFSSTILVIKLLPTTRLHQSKMGAMCISILILQDLVAILVLAFLASKGLYQSVFLSFGVVILKIVIFVAILFLLEQFVIHKMLVATDRWHETIFLLGLAWCFGLASVSHHLGLLYETGAFFGGVVLARHPIALFISESLKPLRDFFLVLFFFVLGVQMDLFVMKGMLWMAVLLATAFIFFKAWVFKKMFVFEGEDEPFAKEAGTRLAQLSEFSLLIAVLALQLGHISLKASQFIQLVTIFTFIISSYLVVFKYPTPIGTTEKLIKD